MWTNIYKIEELQTVSWFQFLPNEPDSTTTSARSSKAEQKDALNNIVLSAYLHLQSDGFLTTWTNSFVGPWDPSQGEHNPGSNEEHFHEEAKIEVLLGILQSVKEAEVMIPEDSKISPAIRAEGALKD